MAKRSVDVSPIELLHWKGVVFIRNAAPYNFVSKQLGEKGVIKVI
jgi:hypothetical protein